MVGSGIRLSEEPGARGPNSSVVLAFEGLLFVWSSPVDVAIVLVSEICVCEADDNVGGGIQLTPGFSLASGLTRKRPASSKATVWPVDRPQLLAMFRGPIHLSVDLSIDLSVSPSLSPWKSKMFLLDSVPYFFRGFFVRGFSTAVFALLIFALDIVGEG
jgi:hypothetical protein